MEMGVFIIVQYKTLKFREYSIFKLPILGSLQNMNK